MIASWVDLQKKQISILAPQMLSKPHQRVPMYDKLIETISFMCHKLIETISFFFFI